MILGIVFLTTFIILAALTRRRRRSVRYRLYDAEAFARDIAAADKNDIVGDQPAPFIADEGPYIGGASGYGRGGFGGRWDGLPNPDAARPRQEDDGSRRFPAAR